MSSDNLISAVLSNEDIQTIINAVGIVRGKLPFLASLTPQERQEMSKMGEKSMGFDEKCTAYMVSHPEFLPGFVDIEEVNKDRALRGQFLSFSGLVNTTNESIIDTLMLIGGDIWMADLAYYQSVREAAKRGRPGAQAIYDDLRSRFPGGGARQAAAAAPKTQPAQS